MKAKDYIIKIHQTNVRLTTAYDQVLYEMTNGSVVHDIVDHSEVNNIAKHSEENIHHNLPTTTNVHSSIFSLSEKTITPKPNVTRYTTNHAKNSTDFEEQKTVNNISVINHNIPKNNRLTIINETLYVSTENPEQSTTNFEYTINDKITNSDSINHLTEHKKPDILDRNQIEIYITNPETPTPVQQITYLDYIFPTSETTTSSPELLCTTIQQPHITNSLCCVECIGKSKCCTIS